MTFYDGPDVGRAVLIELERMARSFLCARSGRGGEETRVDERVRTEDDHGDVDRAKDAQLVGFLEQPVFAL